MFWLLGADRRNLYRTELRVESMVERSSLGRKVLGYVPPVFMAAMIVYLAYERWETHFATPFQAPPPAENNSLEGIVQTEKQVLPDPEKKYH